VVAVASADFTHLYQQAVEQRRQQFGPTHPKVAESLFDLALYALAQGNRTTAVAALRSVVTIRETTKSPGLAEALIELAALENSSPERGLRLLEASPRTPVSPRLAITLTNFAQAIVPNEAILAERLYRQALRAYPPTALDPEYASTLNNYASLLLATERAERAAPYQRRALAIFEKTLGNQHPRTAVAASNLAEITAALGRFAEAEALYRRALAIDQSVYGPHHPEVITDLENLADLLEHTGKDTEARALRQAIEAIPRSPQQ
jgi:tetratricopeptide (TPR) repeat protein